MKTFGSGSTFLDHLEELRSRIIRSLIALVLGAFIAYPLSGKFLSFLIKPLGKAVFTSPQEAFVTTMSVTLWGSVLLVSPYLLFEIWSFVAQGLTARERKYVTLFGPLSFFFFAAGIIFGYFVIVPISLEFLLSFQSEAMVPMISVGRYISFIISFVLAFGIVFELPLILLFLARIGIASPAFLRHNRKYAIVVIFVVSAFLTPPDWVSQLLMALPLVGLYELGIFFAQFAYRQPE